jgi:hypothetical protein
VSDAYPNLGFDPTPGMPDAVESLHGKVNSAVDSMSQASQLMARLRNANDSVWQGDAGNAFRQHFNSKLADDLDHAHQSLSKAVTVVQGWHGDLLNFKDTANKLEAEAGEARKAQQAAEAALKQAKANPDLGLAGQVFHDDASLRAAQSKLDAAETAVRSASSNATGAADKLNDIIRRAKELQSQHEDVARRAADALKDATSKLAPHKPGLFSSICNAFSSALTSVGDWVKGHLKDIHAVLSTISAIGGLVALVTPPPIDLIAAGVAGVAGAGALATDIADPQFRSGMGQLLHGHFNKQSLGALMTGVGDAAGMIPGAGAAKAALKGADAAAEGAAGARTVTDLASSAVHKPGVIVQTLNKIPGVSRLGDAVTVGDKVLSKAIPDVAEGRRALQSVDKLNVLWNAKGVASHIEHDVKQWAS